MTWDLFRNISMHQVTATLILLAGSVVFWDSELFFYSAALFYLCFNIISFWIHEGWVHGYFVGKIRVINFILDWLSYLLFQTSKLNWQFQHRYHHRVWKTEDDRDQYEVDHTPWPIYLLLLCKVTPPHDITSMYSEYLEFCQSNIHRLPPESQFLEKNYKILNVLTHLVLFFVVGAQLYFWLVFVPCWLFLRVYKWFNEVLPHRGYKTKQSEIDRPWLLPICNNMAYHSMHHKNQSGVIYGPGWLKYITLQFWFARIFTHQTVPTLKV